MVDEIIKKHSKDKNLISILQSIQDKYGYIPEEEAREIAKQLDVPLVRLWGVATFYSQFKFTKRGKYVIMVCNGTACHVNHSIEIIEYMKELLEVKEGETTKDGKFTLEIVNCIGACARAPAMMINGTVYGKLTVDAVKKIIMDLKNAK
jgi:NADH-quinone oxidoreductase subunit E